MMRNIRLFTLLAFFVLASTAVAAANGTTVAPDTVLYAVENSLLQERFGTLEQPSTAPECVEGVDSLKNYFRLHPIKDGRGAGMIFRVQVAFVVDTNGEVSDFQLLTHNKGVMLELATKVQEAVKEAPLHWKPATDANGNAVSSWQVLMFTVVECSLSKCDYVH